MCYRRESPAKLCVRTCEQSHFRLSAAVALRASSMPLKFGAAAASRMLQNNTIFAAFEPNIEGPSRAQLGFEQGAQNWSSTSNEALGFFTHR